MKKRYLGVYSHGKFNFMDEKEALCTEHRAYCGVYVANNVLMVDMDCHCERSEAIQFLGRGMQILTGLPRHCVARNDGMGLQEREVA